jgi:DoxX-like protein
LFDVSAAQAHMSGAFLKFIGVAETLGALGLVLPGITRIRTGLTPLAATGLVVIMIGAVAVSVIQGPAIGAIVPFIVGCLCAFVAHRRSV